MIKKLILLMSCLFGLCLLFGFNSYAVADEFDTNSLEIPKLSLDESYVQEVTDKNGDTVTIEVTKVEDGEPEINLRWGVWHTRNNVTNGTYKINVVTGVCNAGFTIKVSNKKITSAYDQWMNGFAPGVSISGSLAKDSSTQATYYMDFSMVGVFWSGGVRAKIQSGNLVTYWQ